MFQRICINIVSAISGAILAVVFILSVLRTCTMESGVWENTIYHKDSFLLNMAVIVLLCAFIRFLKKRNISKETLKKLYIVISFIYFVVTIYSIYLIKPGYDQDACIKAATELLDGNYSMWSYGNYCYAWTNQNGLILYFALIIRVFGANNYMAIYMINTILYWLAACLIRKMYKCYTEEEFTTFAIWACMLLFFPMQCYCGFAYGTVPGFFFSVLTIYLYNEVDKNSKNRASLIFISCVTLFIAICLKGNYMIWALALCIACFVRAYTRRSATQILYFVLLILSFVLATVAPNYFLAKITGNPTNQGVPAIAWVVMGLQTHEGGTAGWFNHYNYNVYIQGGGNHNAAATIATSDLLELLDFYRKNPKMACQFLYQKVASQWINPDFQAHSVLFDRENKGDLLHWFVDDESKYHAIYIWILDRILSIVYFGNLCWLWIKRKCYNLDIRLGYIIFCGGFIFHIFWEGKSQYALPYFMMLIPTAVLGMKEFVNLLIRFKEYITFRVFRHKTHCTF